MIRRSPPSTARLARSHPLFYPSCVELLARNAGEPTHLWLQPAGGTFKVYRFPFNGSSSAPIAGSVGVIRQCTRQPTSLHVFHIILVTTAATPPSRAHVHVQSADAIPIPSGLVRRLRINHAYDGEGLPRHLTHLHVRYAGIRSPSMVSETFLAKWWMAPRFPPWLRSLNLCLDDFREASRILAVAPQTLRVLTAHNTMYWSPDDLKVFLQAIPCGVVTLVVAEVDFAEEPVLLHVLAKHIPKQITSLHLPMCCFAKAGEIPHGLKSLAEGGECGESRCV